MNNKNLKVFQRLIEHNYKIIKEGKLDSLEPKRKLEILYEILISFLGYSNLPKVFVVSLDKINAHAVYYSQDYDEKLLAGNILVDKSDFDSDFVEVLEHFVHEVAHVIQDREWKKSLDNKKRMVKNYKVPPDVSLEEVSFSDIGLFWDEVYGYKNNPLEKEARAFGRKNFAKFFDKYTEGF